ncbi:MAG: T9SS type A sorting domain-containing protein [Flavobacteriales bacterium]|nr:T9SS type A sorting domain-containing protein [Flavobacteriales bacterium]
MTKLISILIVLSGLLASNANYAQQVYFNNRYDYNNSQEVIWSVLEVDSGYMCAVGTGEILLLHLDTLGNKVWEKSFGDSNETFFAGRSGSLVQTVDGGYALGGSVTESTGNNQALLVRFNSVGDTVWTKRFGGGGFDSFNQCKQTLDKGFIAIGATSSGGNDILLIKTDSLGNQQWQQTYGGAGDESGFVVIVCTDGNYLLSGFTNSFGAGGYDAYIIKVNDTGAVQWSQTYGDANNNGGFDISQTADGGYIGSGALYQYTLSGSFPQSKPYIIKLDSLGNIEWDATYGPARFGAGIGTIYQLSDGSFVASGNTNNKKGTPVGNGWTQGIIMKVSSQGDSLWYRELEYATCAENEDYVKDMKPTSDGGFIMAGFFAPMPVAPCNDTGGQDMWVLKLDSCGCAYVGCDSACQQLVGIEDLQLTKAKLTLKIYPNPASSIATVRIPDNTKGIRNYELRIYDITGRELKSYAMQNQPAITINTKELGSGLYFLRLAALGGREEGRILGSGKLVVE